MTTPDDAFDDILDGRQGPEFTDFLRTLRMAYTSSGDSRLSESSRMSIRAAIDGETQAAIASLGQRTTTRWRATSGRWLQARRFEPRNGLLSAPIRYVSLLCGALALVAGLFAYKAATTTNPTVSAASVLRLAAGYSPPQGRFAHFTYRDRVTFSPAWTGTIRCVGTSGRTQVSYSQVWVRAKETGSPQAVIERSKPCDSGTWLGCPSVVIGRQLYEYHGACGADGPDRFADVIALPNDWPSSTLPSNLFYGPSAAHFLQHSFGHRAGVRARHTVFQDHPADELDVKNWPGDSPKDDVVLYFEPKTGLLIGMNSKNKYVTWRVRLVGQQLRGAETAWSRSLAQLPRWRSRADGVISFAGSPRLSDFIRACPGVARRSIPIPTPTATSTSGAGQAPTAQPRYGLLGVCKKVHPDMTRDLLAWRIMRPNMKRLWTAVRLGVFSAGQVRYSIALEKTRLVGGITSGAAVLG